MNDAEVERETGRQSLRVAAVQLEPERLQSVVTGGHGADRRRCIPSARRIVRNVENADRPAVAERIAAEAVVGEHRGGDANLRRGPWRIDQPGGEQDGTKCGSSSAPTGARS